MRNVEVDVKKDGEVVVNTTYGRNKKYQVISVGQLGSNYMTIRFIDHKKQKFCDVMMKIASTPERVKDPNMISGEVVRYLDSITEKQIESKIKARDAITQ